MMQAPYGSTVDGFQTGFKGSLTTGCMAICMWFASEFWANLGKDVRGTHVLRTIFGGRRVNAVDAEWKWACTGMHIFPATDVQLFSRR